MLAFVDTFMKHWVFASSANVQFILNSVIVSHGYHNTVL